MTFADLWPMLRHVLVMAVLVAVMWDACREKKPRKKQQHAAAVAVPGKPAKIERFDKEDAIDAEYEVLP